MSKFDPMAGYLTDPSGKRYQVLAEDGTLDEAKTQAEYDKANAEAAKVREEAMAKSDEAKREEPILEPLRAPEPQKGLVASEPLVEE